MDQHTQRELDEFNTICTQLALDEDTKLQAINFFLEYKNKKS